MRTETQTQVKAAQIRPPIPSVQTDFLQRKCACGGSSGLAGDCKDCQEKRLTLQRYAADRSTFSKPPGLSKQDSHVTDDSPLGHNFNEIGIHHASRLARELQGRDLHSDNATSATSDPQAILAQLGSGQSFSGSSRTRMESVFARDFSPVRIHTDTHAAQLSQRLNAQAFTIGNHIAFASGHYQPGTVIGDALLAHELAHVSQQSNANVSALAMQAGGAEYDALEKDADVSAEQAVISLWGHAKGLATGVAQTAMPRLQSGLRLSRCNGGKKEEKKAPEAEKKALSCTEVCDLAYADSSLNQGGGGVVCYNGVKCPCVFDVPPAKRGECPELDEIVLIHERRHVPEGDCIPDKIHRLGPKDPSKLAEIECPHREESVKLLEEAIKKQDDAAPCKAKMTTIRDMVNTWVKANCGK